MGILNFFSLSAFFQLVSSDKRLDVMVTGNTVGPSYNRFEGQLHDYPWDCQDISWRYNFKPDGVNNIRSTYTDYFDAFCTSDKWTVIQSRGQFGNPQDYFYRNWVDYENGFGEPGKERWMGLRHIFEMTNYHNYSLRITMEDQLGEIAEVTYENFKLVKPNYTLEISGYKSSLASDALVNHNGHQFTTKDKDNDNHGDNCAQRFMGAWWYTSCHHSNLNGINTNNISSPYAISITWSTWKGQHHSMRSVQMAIKKNTS